MRFTIGFLLGFVGGLLSLVSGVVGFFAGIAVCQDSDDEEVEELVDSAETLAGVEPRQPSLDEVSEAMAERAAAR